MFHQEGSNTLYVGGQAMLYVLTFSDRGVRDLQVGAFYSQPILENDFLKEAACSRRCVIVGAVQCEIFPKRRRFDDVMSGTSYLGTTAKHVVMNSLIQVQSFPFSLTSVLLVFSERPLFMKQRAWLHTVWLNVIFISGFIFSLVGSRSPAELRQGTKD